MLLKLLCSNILPPFPSGELIKQHWSSPMRWYPESVVCVGVYSRRSAEQYWHFQDLHCSVWK